MGFLKTVMGYINRRNERKKAITIYKTVIVMNEMFRL